MARVLIDTSAWIEFYHPKGTAQVRTAVLQALEREQVGLAAPIVVELLSGAKTEGEFSLLLSDLRGITFWPLTQREAETAAHLAWKLARRGQRVPTVDALLAGVAAVQEAEVWHYGDRHFSLIAEAGGPPHRDLRAV